MGISKFINKIRNLSILDDSTADVKSEATINSIIPLSSWAVSFDGERFEGEMGSIKNYLMDYPRLRLRGWQAFVESDIVKGILNKYKTWVVGEGLKLQSTPVTSIIESSIPQFDRKEFTKDFESRFSVWATSKRSSWSGESTLQQLAGEAYKNIKIAGDVLVVLRVEDSTLKVELIDSDLVKQPPLGILKDPRVEHGVKTDKRGKHISYYVATSDPLKFNEVKAYDKQGRRVAYMVYGEKFRPGSVRGTTLMATVLASIKTLTRYKDASVMGAEERAKVPFFIEHNENSTEENIYASQVQASVPTNKVAGGALSHEEGIKTASAVAATVANSVFNMPKGATINSIKTDQEITFSEFFKGNHEVVCAAMNIPIEVALSKYDSNYAASQGARTDWMRVCTLDRNDFGTQFYQPIINLFLEIESIKGTINIQNLSVTRIKDPDLFDSITKCRWVGVNMTNIDPVKDVKAWREKLGAAAADIPLATVDEAVEALSTGDADSTIETFAQEREAYDERIGDDLAEKKIAANTPVEPVTG